MKMILVSQYVLVVKATSAAAAPFTGGGLAPSVLALSLHVGSGGGGGLLTSSTESGGAAASSPCFTRLLTEPTALFSADIPKLENLQNTAQPSL